MEVGNFIVKEVDKFSITYSQLKSVTKRNGSKADEYVESKRYFTTLDSCLEDIKKRVKIDMVETEKDIVDAMEFVKNNHVQVVVEKREEK